MLLFSMRCACSLICKQSKYSLQYVFISCLLLLLFRLQFVPNFGFGSKVQINLGFHSLVCNLLNGPCHLQARSCRQQRLRKRWASPEPRKCQKTVRGRVKQRVYHMPSQYYPADLLVNLTLRVFFARRTILRNMILYGDEPEKPDLVIVGKFGLDIS